MYREKHDMPGKETMTARDRMCAALNHEEPDRVPIDFGGFQTGIHKNAYASLLGHLGIGDVITMLDPVQQLARPCEEILERFHVDTRYVLAHGPDGFKGQIEQNERDGRLWYDLTDEFGVIWSMPEDHQLYMDISHHPLAGASIRDVENYPFPDGTDTTRFTSVRDEALRLREQTEPCACGNRRITLCAPASVAWFTNTVGISAAWSSGSWTLSRIPCSANRCLIVC
jgi:uroporphyrinogen decarboxylase